MHTLLFFSCFSPVVESSRQFIFVFISSKAFRKVEKGYVFPVSVFLLFYYPKTRSLRERDESVMFAGSTEISHTAQACRSLSARHFPYPSKSLPQKVFRDRNENPNRVFSQTAAKIMAACRMKGDSGVPGECVLGWTWQGKETTSSFREKTENRVLTW